MTDPAPLSPSPAATALIQRFEGCARARADGSFEAYPDPGTGADPWTIGWGSTGPDIGAQTVWSKAQCDTRLVRDVGRFAAQIAALIGPAPTTQNQFDALVCFAYNLGVGALKGSTLLRRHLAGDTAGAAGEFAKWVRAGGRVLPGLVKRRAAEAALYAAQ